MAEQTAKTRFEKLTDNGWLNRAEKYSYWTIPYLYTRQGAQNQRGDQVAVEGDFQSVGSMLVNNLAPKLVRLLFPANRAFFRADLSPDMMKAATAEGVSETDVAAKIAKMELAASQRLFQNAAYAQLVLLAKYLLVAGDGLLYRDSKARRTYVYGPGQYALRRGNAEELLEVVIRDFTTVDALDHGLRADLLRSPTGEKYREGTKAIELYTHVLRCPTKRGKRWEYKVKQEVDGIPVGKTSTYPEKLCPFIAPTCNRKPGENYGRGIVEDYRGDFARLSNSSEAGSLYEAEAFRLVHLVQAGSGTDISRFANAETGDWVPGDPASVQAYEAGMWQKLSALGVLQDAILARLSRAFMYTGNTRQAERVTAYEIMKEAEEAEETLGGLYSTWAESWQVPLARLLLAEESPNHSIAISLDLMDVEISAGLPALKRSADLEALVAATQEGSIVIALTQLDSRISAARVMDLVYASRGIDSKALMKSAEEQAADAQQAQALAQGEAAAASAQSLQTVNQLANQG